jgi:phosphate/sulfate permease
MFLLGVRGLLYLSVSETAFAAAYSWIWFWKRPAVGGYGTTAVAALVGDYRQFHKYQWIPVIWLVMTGVVDILIAVTLVWYLVSSTIISEQYSSKMLSQRARRQTGFQKTEDIIRRITASTSSDVLSRHIHF